MAKGQVQAICISHGWTSAFWNQNCAFAAAWLIAACSRLPGIGKGLSNNSAPDSFSHSQKILKSVYNKDLTKAPRRTIPIVFNSI
jgi:hypothetical protein